MRIFEFAILFLTSISGLVSFSQCAPVVNQQFWSFDTGGSNSDHQQTFQVSAAGELSRIGIQVNGGLTGTFTLSVYEGSGITGTLLYSGSHSYSGLTGTQYEVAFNIPCDQMPMLAVGTVYTFRIQGGLPIVYHSVGSYSSGTYLTYGDPRDMNFKIYLSDPNKPAITTTFSNPTCFGYSDGLATSTVTGGTTPYSYNWNTGPTTSTITGLTAGTYVLNVTDISGCNACPDTVILIDPPQVTANAGVNVSICQGMNHNMTATAPNATTYSWSPTTGLSNPLILNPIASPSTATTYTLTASNANGCSATDDIFVNVYPTPVVSAGADQTVCESSPTISLSGSTTNSIGDLWTTSGSGTFGNPTALNTTYTPSASDILAGSVVITLTGDASGPCPSITDNLTLTINPAPTVNAGADQTICAESPTVVLGGTVTGATGGTWTSTGTGTFVNPNSLNTNYICSASDILAGTVTLTLTTTGNGACAAVQDQMTITINPTPTITAGTDQTVCDGTSVTLTAINSPGTLTWNNGVSDGVPFTPSVGTVTYIASIVDVNSCTATDQVIVTVNPLPFISLSCSDADQIICSGELVTFSATAGYSSYTFFIDGSPAQGPGSANTFTTTTLTNGQTITVETTSLGCTSTAPESYTMVVNVTPVATFNTIPGICENAPPYTLIEGAPAGGNYSGPGVFSGIFYPDTVGIGSYTLTYVAVNGSCTDTAFQIVNVVPPPLVNAGPDQVICEGQMVTLSGSGATTYTWNTGITNGVAFAPPIGTNVYVVDGVNTGGCGSLDTVIVSVNPTPGLTVSSDQTFCAGDTILLFASGAQTYDWDSGASTTSTYSLIPNASVIITVTGGNTFGCSSTDSVELTFDDPSVIDAGADQIICNGFTVYLSASGGDSYVWNGPGIVDQNTQDINFAVDTTAYYIVHVTTTNGCVYPDSVLVTLNDDPSCSIETVTSITPNADGVNDFWKIEGIEGFPDNTVTIYNRWGDVIFSEQGYDNDNIKWEGKIQSGDIAPSGTYYYLIKIENGPSTTGWIQLMK
ncbi:MAG: gliding motility-associated C-terminal domain-containing protein [Crocinitomicaceae bacterium]